MCGKGSCFCYVVYVIEINSGIQTYLIVCLKCVVTGLCIYCFKKVRENFTRIIEFWKDADELGVWEICIEKHNNNNFY